MTKILGLITAFVLILSIPARAQDDSPPFDSFVCHGDGVTVTVEIQHYRQTHGAGPASLEVEGLSWAGGWQWSEAALNTRLAGYHFIDVKANGPHGPLSLHSLFTPFGALGAGWLEMNGVSTLVKCDIVE